MMPIDITILKKGKRYSRVKLAALWGYKGLQALARGIVTPSNDNKIILFVTHEKRSGDTQYEDSLEGDILTMEGENRHQSDFRILNSFNSGDEIYLFFREKHDDVEFEFMGEYYLVDAYLKEDRPSKFTFSPYLNDAAVADRIWAEALTHGAIEGGQKYQLHIVYERNRANRQKAIELHGPFCSICGFSFDQKYGTDLARGYIEVHHILPLSSEERRVDPLKDLIPVCSNCHSMLHRNRGSLLNLETLRESLKSD